MLKSYEILIPLVLIVTACFLILFFRILMKNKQNDQGIKWLFLLPPLASLGYWFFTAPDLRFVRASFWVLGVGGLTLSLSQLSKLKKIVIFWITLLILAHGSSLKKHLLVKNYLEPKFSLCATPS